MQFNWYCWWGVGVDHKFFMQWNAYMGNQNLDVNNLQSKIYVQQKKEQEDMEPALG